MLYYLLIIIFYFLFFWLSHKNIRWGIYLTLLFLPAYQIRFQVFGLPATLLAGMIWLLLIAWLLKLKKEKNLTFNPVAWINNIKNSRIANPRPDSASRSGRGGRESRNLIPRPFRLPIILLLIAATISAFVSPQLQSALGVWKAYFVEALLFFVVFVYNIRTFGHVKYVIRILGILTIAIGIFAIYQKLTGDLIPNPYWAEQAIRRVTTFFGYPNANALLIAPIILLTLGNLLTDLRFGILNSGFGIRDSGFAIRDMGYTIFNLLVLILGMATILWTKSAGALIGLIAGIASLLIFYKKTRLITLAGLLILIFIFSSQIQNKIQSYYISASEIHLSDRPSDVQLRVQQWRETLAMLKDTPLFGPGLAGYQTLMAPYHVNKHIEIFLYPHNFFLNFWSETGLLGLVSIIWILVVFFILGFKRELFKPSLLNLTILSAMIALLVHGLVDVPYFKNDLAILFWVVVGMMILLNKIQETNSKLQTSSKSQISNSKQLDY